MLIGHATAQERVYRYDSVAIDSSIKCELSQVATMLAGRVDASRMKANIAVRGEETISTKIEAGFKFWIWGAGGNYKQETGKIRGAFGDRNIHVDNSINCRKSFVVDVGVLSCFREQEGLFVSGQTITCTDKSSATASANANGKFDVWVINAGPSGDIAKTRVWQIEVVAPPKK